MFIRPIVVGIFLLVAACSQLPPTASVTVPPIPPGQARVWFYRDGGPYDGVGTPYLRMNDAIVGVSEPGGASYRDVLAGPYHITVDSYGKDFSQDQDVQIASGQELYFKIVSLRNWVMGGSGGGDATSGDFARDTFYVRVIPPEVARADVARSAFYGGG
jgi:hypothetical protein